MQSNRFDSGQEELVAQAQFALTSLAEELLACFELLDDRRNEGHLDEAGSFALKLLRQLGVPPTGDAVDDDDSPDITWELYLLRKDEVTLPRLNEVG